MALTTESAQKITDTTIAQGKGRSRTIEADILFDKSIVAKPLNVPEVASIHVKNVEYYYRWVNRLHGHGEVYMQRKAMGFTNATNEDVDVLVGDDIVSTESELRSGDVILMKIPFAKWAAHVKRNMVTAEQLQRARGVYNREEELSSDVFSDGNQRVATQGNLESVKQTVRGKVTPFLPENPDAILDASEPTAAREQIQEIREGIKAGRPVRPAPKEK